MKKLHVAILLVLILVIALAGVGYAEISNQYKSMKLWRVDNDSKFYWEGYQNHPSQDGQLVWSKECNSALNYVKVFVIRPWADSPDFRVKCYSGPRQTPTPAPVQ
jgi:hypothetical protein